MKLSDLSFADTVAIEILPAIVAQSRYLGEHPERAAARAAYMFADALAAEHAKRNTERTPEKIAAHIRARAEIWLLAGTEKLDLDLVHQAVLEAVKLYERMS